MHNAAAREGHVIFHQDHVCAHSFGKPLFHVQAKLSAQVASKR